MSLPNKGRWSSRFKRFLLGWRPQLLSFWGKLEVYPQRGMRRSIISRRRRFYAPSSHKENAGIYPISYYPAAPTSCGTSGELR